MRMSWMSKPCLRNKFWSFGDPQHGHDLAVDAGAEITFSWAHRCCPKLPLKNDNKLNPRTSNNFTLFAPPANYIKP